MRLLLLLLVLLTLVPVVEAQDRAARLASEAFEQGEIPLLATGVLLAVEMEEAKNGALVSIDCPDPEGIEALVEELRLDRSAVGLLRSHFAEAPGRPPCQIQLMRTVVRCRQMAPCPNGGSCRLVSARAGDRDWTPVPDSRSDKWEQREPKTAYACRCL